MSRVIDMTGKKINRLTVLERATNSSQGKARWKCVCECGNIVVVEGSSLRNGHVKSCGCLQRDRTSETCRIDLTGKTIGNFTVLEYVQKKYEDNNHSKWRCRCNLCGNEYAYIETSNLDKQYSCGCAITSKGERKIKELLENNTIKFIQEKRFSNCVFENGMAARFDFYLPDFNCIIEYDGIQHFVQGEGAYDNKEKYEQTKKYDLIKNEYCWGNNIILIRIPYIHYDKIKIEDLLPSTSNFIVYKEPLN